MPPLPAVPGVIQARLKFTAAASIDVGYGFHLSYTGGAPSGTDMSTLAASIAAKWNSNQKDNLPDDLTLIEITCTDLSSSSGSVGEWTGSESGNISGAMLSASASFCMNHTISRRYRGGKPKTFLPGVQASDLTGTNEISSASIALQTSSWEDFVAAILGTTGLSMVLQDIVNVSYYSGFTAVLNPVTGRYRNVPKLRAVPVVDPIRSSSCAQKLGSQRRRLNL